MEKGKVGKRMDDQGIMNRNPGEGKEKGKGEGNQALPDSLHFVGVGGIGMSGLAQMARFLGCAVSGSDRALESPENAAIFSALRACGVTLYPQDGSFCREKIPGALVYSSAIEEDNPDFLSAAPVGIRRLHRSEALSLCMGALGEERPVFAVSGTCGKTTVSAWLGEAMENLGVSPGFLCGGLLNAFASAETAGNFRAGGPHGPFVIEADESDKSLLNYTADRSLVLNIGTDHYSKEELARVFREFVRKTRDFSVMEDAAFLASGGAEEFGKEERIVLFSGDESSPERLSGRRVLKLDSYRVSSGASWCSFDGMPEIRLPLPGRHNAVNALAVYASLLESGFSARTACEALSSFRGVWRRFDYAGRTSRGAAVYDDYAHNVEKILSCLNAAREITHGRILALFQPHGFGPLKFMREELFLGLEKTLRKDDVFGFLPVYYAGGTASFTPTSEEVSGEYRERSGAPLRYPFFPSREAAEAFTEKWAEAADTVLVMGARDNSLSDWSRVLGGKNESLKL